jgi:hypothetical protein
MATSKILDTATFDQKLLMLGRWERQNRENIEKWIKTQEDQKKEAASKLISYLIQNLLSKDCTAEGKKCSKHLGDTFAHLEELLHTTKGGISKKFYRDHLNHMLRVMILSRAVAMELKDISVSEEEMKLLVLAALFHDIAYPLSEVNQVFSGVTEALNKCYRSMSYPKMIIALDMNIATQLIQNLKLPTGMTISDLGKYFSSNNHGILGAMEFLQYIRPEVINNYIKVLDAIMFHDPDYNIPIDAKQSKILALLVICDEMQDWGRPASFEQEPTISEIRDFDIKRNEMQGKFVWDETSKLSPLRQILSKQRSLKRICLANLDKEIKIKLCFGLPTYMLFEHEKFQDKLQELFHSWSFSKASFDSVVQDMPIETYQRLYYGLAGENENLLISDLQAKKIRENSKFKNKNMYYSFNRRELLSISSSVGVPQEISFELNKTGLNTIVNGAKSSLKGLLISEPDVPASTLEKLLISELFLFDFIVKHKYAKQQGETKGETTLLVSDSKVLSFLEKENDGEEIADLFKRAGEIRYCLKDKGYFLYS